MAGYSGTPLAKKLGYKPGFRAYLKNPPADYSELVAPLPDGITLSKRLTGQFDMVHFFTKSRVELAGELPKLMTKLTNGGMVWVSWPKKASKVPTDITEDTIREIALPLGLVDVKVCAVDEVWSGLKLVVRKANR